MKVGGPKRRPWSVPEDSLVEDLFKLNRSDDEIATQLNISFPKKFRTGYAVERRRSILNLRRAKPPAEFPAWDTGQYYTFERATAQGLSDEEICALPAMRGVSVEMIAFHRKRAADQRAAKQEKLDRAAEARARETASLDQVLFGTPPFERSALKGYLERQAAEAERTSRVGIERARL